MVVLCICRCMGSKVLRKLETRCFLFALVSLYVCVYVCVFLKSSNTTGKEEDSFMTGSAQLIIHILCFGLVLHIVRGQTRSSGSRGMWLYECNDCFLLFFFLPLFPLKVYGCAFCVDDVIFFPISLSLYFSMEGGYY